MEKVLSVTFHINCSFAHCLINMTWDVPLSGHDDVTLFE